MSGSEARSAVLLVDNGTLEPAAILRLRQLAATLGERLGRRVEPVSLQHSDRVSAALLDGRCAEVLEPALRVRVAEGITDFLIVPVFIGPTRALSKYLPQVIDRVRADRPTIKVRVALPLYADAEDRLAQMIAGQVEDVMTRTGWDASTRVALVDHGSPVREVTEVRDRVADHLAQLLRERVAAVSPCSMDRRPDAEYDFNEPLLANLLATPLWNAGQVVVAHLFLLPGRHAGEGGDIAQICARAESENPGLQVARAGLLGDAPGLIDVLVDRYRAVLA